MARLECVNMDLGCDTRIKGVDNGSPTVDTGGSNHWECGLEDRLAVAACFLQPSACHIMDCFSSVRPLCDANLFWKQLTMD